MQTIRVHEVGGPEALRYETVPDPKPGPSEALVEVKAVGVNFIDIYQRTGLYPMALPFVTGSEASGVFAEV